MKISSVSQMRQLDQTAISTYGIADELLMENAGLAVFEVIRNRIGIEGRQFTIFCGAGNNGGDGFVVARKIHAGGGTPTVYLMGNPDKYSGAARLNWQVVNKLPIEISPCPSPEKLKPAIAHCDAVVDAIFGTGLARDVGGAYADVIEVVNRWAPFVISVDIPSGIHGDTGRIMGTAVQADATVTFGLPKYGNFLYPGFDHCGQLYVTHISFPPAMYRGDDFKVAINTPITLPDRDETGHKGSFGDALFVAGGAQYYGAPYFAAQSFLKAGGGYSRLACPAGMVPAIAAAGKEIVYLPQRATHQGNLSLETASAISGAAEQVDIVVLGPGLGLEEDTGELVCSLLKTVNKPLILDGDGITAICNNLDLLRQRQAPTILTPHPGEMARLTGLAVAAIEENRIPTLQKAAKKINAMIVLKGAHSLIGYPDGTVHLNLSGNDGLATAGSGDVLTGTIAAMFGLGLGIEDAVRKGVMIHGLAADLAADAIGKDGMTAQTVLEYLPAALKVDRSGLPERLKKKYRGFHLV